jgi:hypothetical protein
MSGGRSREWSCAIAFLAISSTCGCGEEECPPPVQPLAVRVTVADASTGEPLCEARVTARSASREEVLFHVAECTYGGGWGPGTYEISAEKAGFGSNTKSGIHVRSLSEKCDRFETVDVPMELTPL